MVLGHVLTEFGHKNLGYLIHSAALLRSVQLMALPIWHSGPILRVRNLGPESRVRNFSRPWENPLNQEFLPKPILLAQNLELGEFWGKNDGFKGKFLVLENFLGSGKIPDPRFQTQIPDPMVGSGMSDGQSHCIKDRRSCPDFREIHYHASSSISLKDLWSSSRNIWGPFGFSFDR